MAPSPSRRSTAALVCVGGSIWVGGFRFTWYEVLQSEGAKEGSREFQDLLARSPSPRCGGPVNGVLLPLLPLSWIEAVPLPFFFLFSLLLYACIIDGWVRSGLVGILAVGAPSSSLIDCWISESVCGHAAA